MCRECLQCVSPRIQSKSSETSDKIGALFTQERTNYPNSDSFNADLSDCTQSSGGHCPRGGLKRPLFDINSNNDNSKEHKQSAHDFAAPRNQKNSRHKPNLTVAKAQAKLTHTKIFHVFVVTELA